MAEVCRLFFVSDRTTGVRFLVDSGAQISIISATKEDRLKRTYKLTLQIVNKSLIKTYEHIHIEPRLKKRFHAIFYSGYREINVGCQ